MAEQPHLSLILVPDGARESRTFRISYGRLRLLAMFGLAVAVLVTAIVGSWWYFAARAVRVGEPRDQAGVIGSGPGAIGEPR